MKDYLLQALIVTAVAGLMFLVFWAAYAAPCSAYKYTSNKDIPARCLGEFTN